MLRIQLFVRWSARPARASGFAANARSSLDQGPRGQFRGEIALEVLLAASLCLLVFFALSFPVTDTDIWWHLAAGRKLLEQGRFLREDPFAEDVIGRPWLNLHWLFQLLAYGAYRAGGLRAIVLGKAAVGALAALLLLRASEEAERPRVQANGRLAMGAAARALAVLLVALPIYAARFLVLERPVIITLLMLSVYLLLLERTRHGDRARVLWLLLPLQVIWVNAQGGLALLGPAVVGAYLAGAGLAALFRLEHSQKPRLRTLGLCLLGLLLSCLLNPYGPRGLGLPLVLLGRIEALGSDVFSLNVSENIPPFLLERSQASAVWHFKWVAAAAFASFLLARPWIVALPRLLLLAGFFGLALLANRNILLFEWVAGFAAVPNLVPLLELRPQSPRWLAGVWKPGLVSVALCALVTLGLLRWRASLEEGSLAEPAPFRVPVRAVERLRALQLPGRLFNSVRYGGYLAFQLHASPGYRPSIDGRLVLRSDAQFAEHLDLLDHPARFGAFARARDIRLALLPSAYPDRYLPLLVELCRDRAWKLIDTDGTEALLARDTSDSLPGLDLRSSVTVSRIAEELRLRYRFMPKARDVALLHLGRLLAETGSLERASEVLEALAFPPARGLLARVHFLAGRRQQAAALAQDLLRDDPDEVNSLDLLALIALDEGKHRQALELARRALESNPFDVAARRILLRLRGEAAAGD